MKSYEFAINPKVLAISNRPSSLDGGLVISGKNESILKEVTKLENELSNARLKYLENSLVVKVYKERLDKIKNTFKKNQIETIDAALSLNSSKLDILRSQMASLKSSFKNNPKLIKEFNSLQQEVSIANNNLKSLITVQENLQLELAQKSIPWKIIQYPTLNNKNLIFSLTQDSLLYILISFIFALITSSFKDKINNVFSNSKEIEREINSPILGIFPKLDFSFIQSDSEKNFTVLDKINFLDNYYGENQLINITKNSYKEAIKNLYSSLDLFESKNKVNKISITSSIRGEGKTFLCIVISKVLSELGKKIILIDSDLRSKNLSKEINIKNNIGIVDFINDNKTKIKDLITNVPKYQNIDIITPGKNKIEDPTKLLMSERFKLLVKEVENLNNYDLIIFDNPPSFFTTENKTIANLCRATLLVVTVNKVKKDLPKKLLKNMSLSNQNIGIIINDFHAENIVNVEEYPYDYYSKDYASYDNTD